MNHIEPSYVFVAEAARTLIAADHGVLGVSVGDVHTDAGYLLAALSAHADKMLDATPDSMRTRPHVESFLHGAVPGWRRAIVLAASALDRGLRPEWRVGQEIRSTHPDSFMRDVWGTIVAIEEAPLDGRLCWAVRWDDGANDLWACDDPLNHIEFRDPTPPALPQAPVLPTRIDLTGAGCPTCGLLPEDPDDREPIQPGDYYTVDPSSPTRCPTCGTVPSRGSEAAARVAAARGTTP